MCAFVWPLYCFFRWCELCSYGTVPGKEEFRPFFFSHAFLEGFSPSALGLLLIPKPPTLLHFAPSLVLLLLVKGEPPFLFEGGRNKCCR